MIDAHARPASLSPSTRPSHAQSHHHTPAGVCGGAQLPRRAQRAGRVPGRPRAARRRLRARVDRGGSARPPDAARPGPGHCAARVRRARRGRCSRPKPARLSFEQACTLPITWSTAHVALVRAPLRAGSAAVHAARGRRGARGGRVRALAAARVDAPPAGRTSTSWSSPAGARALCSSRDGAAFACGAACAAAQRPLHAVLNSLSRDFISARRRCSASGRL